MNYPSVRSESTLLIALFFAGCVSVAPPPHTDIHSSRYRRVSPPELMSQGTIDVVHALILCRPYLMTGRGPERPVPYLDGIRLTGLGSLRAVDVREVAEVVFLTATEATTHFGVGHTGGAILVRTR